MAGAKILVTLALVSLVLGGPLTIMEVKKVDNVGIDLCPTCVNLLGQVISQLMNVILSGGVIGGCSDLCGHLSQKLEVTVCNAICDVAGIKAFTAAIQAADLSPIYACELMNTCPHSDGGKAAIKQMQVAPPTGEVGTTFDIGVGFSVTNATSTGVIEIFIDGPGAFATSTSALNEGFKEGDYSVDFKLATKQGDDPQDSMLPGVYNVTVMICNAECGSDHQWAGKLDEGSSSFHLTV